MAKTSGSYPTKTQISDWLDTLQTPRTQLGGLSICPYLLKNRKNVHIMQTTDPRTAVFNFVNLHRQFNLVAVVIYGFRWSYSMMEYQTAEMNRLYQDKNVQVLMMHPEAVMEPLPIEYNYHKCPILIAQLKDQLESSRKELQKSDYYKKYHRTDK
jgi:hypothetical protein